jgi:hypothetical protein
MTTQDHRKLLQLTELPESVRIIIEDYEAALARSAKTSRELLNFSQQIEKRLRISEATVAVMREVIEEGKSTENLRDKIRRMAVGDEDNTLRFNIIEHRVTYGGPGSDARTIHKCVGYRFVLKFFRELKLEEKRSPFQERFRTKEDSMGCYSFYKIEVCEL